MAPGSLHPAVFQFPVRAPAYRRLSGYQRIVPAAVLQSQLVAGMIRKYPSKTASNSVLAGGLDGIRTNNAVVGPL